MTSTTLHTTEGHSAWPDVIALLIAAADQGSLEALTTPAILNTSWGITLAASGAIDLLPVGQHHRLDQVRLDPSTATQSAAGLLHAAGRAARAIPTGQRPAGAGEVIASIDGLIEELPQ